MICLVTLLYHTTGRGLEDTHEVVYLTGNTKSLNNCDPVRTAILKCVRALVAAKFLCPHLEILLSSDSSVYLLEVFVLPEKLFKKKKPIEKSLGVENLLCE
jgi:hypothetical protein